MAFLLILVALLGFAFAAFGSSGGSSSSTTVTAPPPIVKCSKRMHVEPASSRCRPPANP